MRNTYIFTRENGEKEEIQPERWGWAVIYNDGAELGQFEGDPLLVTGIFHQFKEIDQGKVKAFLMVKQGEGVRILLTAPGARLFHLYRNIALNVGAPDERRLRVYVFGYKKDGRVAYHYILPDDRLLISDTDLVNLTPYL